MRLFDAAEAEAAMHKFCEMVSNSDISFSDLCIKPQSDDTDDPINDSYLLQQMQETARRMEASYRSAEADRKKAEAKIAKIQKELDTAKQTIATQAEQLAELSKPTPTKVTHARWQCLHDVFSCGYDEVTDKRSRTACEKAGWINARGDVTLEGRAIMDQDEPAVPKPRVTVKQMRTKLETVEHERDEAYDRVDELLTILEAPEDALWACQAAVGVINGFRSTSMRNAAH
jgi:hypothetical protein